MNIFYKEVTQRCPHGIVVFEIFLSLLFLILNSLRALTNCEPSRSENHSIKTIFKPARCWWWVTNQITRHFNI